MAPAVNDSAGSRAALTICVPVVTSRLGTCTIPKESSRLRSNECKRNRESAGVTVPQAPGPGLPRPAIVPTAG